MFEEHFMVSLSFIYGVCLLSKMVLKISFLLNFGEAKRFKKDIVPSYLNIFLWFWVDLETLITPRGMVNYSSKILIHKTMSNIQNFLKFTICNFTRMKVILDNIYYYALLLFSMVRSTIYV
jgi:hypothetical protein